MANLIDIYNLSQPKGELFARVQGALIKASWNIQNESVATTNHANRLAFAARVLKDPDVETRAAYRLVMSNTTIQSKGLDSTDDDVIFTVNSFIDTLANKE